MARRYRTSHQGIGLPDYLIAATAEHLGAAVDPQPAPLPDVPGPAAALLMAAVTVVGAGVSGLTTALRLAEAGHDVTVVARDRPADTTSAVAAALWFPYRVLPYDRVLAWSATGYTAFARLAADRPVRRPPALGHGAAAPGARRRVVGTGRARPGRHPSRRATRRDGGSCSQSSTWAGTCRGWPPRPRPRVSRWCLRPSSADLAGLGARGRLRRPRRPGPGPRSHRHPVRGQVVVTDPVGVEEWVSDDLDERTLTYVIPRIDDVVVGGTAEEGAWGTEPDPAVAGDPGPGGGAGPGPGGRHRSGPTRSASARPARRSAWRPSAGAGRRSCTTTATAAPASRSRGRAPTRWWRWSAVPELRHDLAAPSLAAMRRAVSFELRAQNRSRARTGRWSERTWGTTSAATTRTASLARMWSVWLCGRGDG